MRRRIQGMGGEFVEPDSRSRFDVGEAGAMVTFGDRRVQCHCGSEWWATKVVFGEDGEAHAVLISGVTCAQCGQELPLTWVRR